MSYTELMVWHHIVQHITAGIQLCVETCGNEMSDLLYSLVLWINFCGLNLCYEIHKIHYTMKISMRTLIVVILAVCLMFKFECCSYSFC